MSDKYPRRNLPGGAEAWGRGVESQINQARKTLDLAEQRLRNDQRWEAGQAAVLSRQIDNLYEQSLEIRTVPNFSVSGSATSEPFPRASQTVTFSAPQRSRSALLMTYGVLQTSSSSGIHSGAVEIIYKGAVVGKMYSNWSNPGTVPSGWSKTLSYMSEPCRVSLPAEEAPEITLRLIREGDPFSPGSSTVTFRDISVSLLKSES